MSQRTVRVASEEPEEFRGGLGRVRKRLVCASEETEEALAGFEGTRRLSRWLRMSHKTVWVASEQPEVALGGGGGARGRCGWLRKKHTTFWVVWEELEADTGFGCAKKGMLLTIGDYWKQPSGLILKTMQFLVPKQN